MAKKIINLTAGESYALQGRIVTMNDRYDVLDDSVIYIRSGHIVGVLPVSAPPPPGFENCVTIRTGGTIYPGLIELHNHLSYNALPPWTVPQKFTNRGQWGKVPDYRKYISGPMQILGKTPGYVEAIVRYVECKCLLGGVTTSQGIALASNQGIQKYYCGVTRNVEEPDHPDLPKARARISDVAANDVEKFYALLKRESSCFLLHLSEGIDEEAHKHFAALQLQNGEWAITPALSGIHSAGLKPGDFKTMQSYGGSIVWSPLSNFLLYGNTADIRAAKESGMLIGIGSDWSPSGSKNLLGELKVARLESDKCGGLFTNPEILALATRNPAKILKWDNLLGSLETGKLADLIVVKGKKGDPYDLLLKSNESAIRLVVINGTPRYGVSSLMNYFGTGTENWKVGNSKRILNLTQETADPVVGTLTLEKAKNLLAEGMQNLPELAANLESAATGLAAGAAEVPGIQWTLVLDHDEMEGEAQRHHLPYGADGLPTGDITVMAAAEPLSTVVSPIRLDPLTVVDDDEFLTQLANQKNLPDYIKTGLPNWY